jgi:hypothetical protein
VFPYVTPQAAVGGFIVPDNFELFFDTVESTRKVADLRQNAAIAFVIGGLAKWRRAASAQRVRC